MSRPALRACVAVLAFLLPACSDGGGGPAAITEQGLAVVTTYPAAYEWAAERAEMALAFNRPLDPDSVRARTVTVRRRDGADVAGLTTVDGAFLRWHPAEPLREGWYELEASHDVRARDGTEWNPLDARRVEFAVRRDAGRWSHPAVLGAAGSEDPSLVVDPLGGAALAWLLDGTVWVAEFDRDKGWLAATPVMTVATSPEPPRLLVARGSGALAVAIVQPQTGFEGYSAVRLRVSNSFDREGRRTWSAAPVTFIDVLRQPARMHVDADSAVVMLLVTPSSEFQQLRLLRFVGHDLRSDDRLSRAVDEVVVERVDLGVQGEVAVAWNEIVAGVSHRYVRVARQRGLDPAEPLAAVGAPRDGGFDGAGNAWTLVPASTTTMRFRTQSAQRWSETGVELSYDVGRLTSSDLDLLTLVWRSEGGAATLSATRVDRSGRVVAATDLFGPTFETLDPIALTGDPNLGALALWRAGDQLLYSRLQRGTDDALAWTPARAWHPDHLPVPIERAVLTPAGRGRSWFTFVDRGRLVATFHETDREMPRPMRNELSWTDGDPLRRSFLAGTATGHLLLVRRTDREFQGQWLR